MESTKKSLKEATNTGYTLEDLERLLKIDEDTGYSLGIIPQPKNEEVALAWDAGIKIEGDKIKIEGNLLPGGFGVGSVKIECGLNIFKKCYDLRGDLYGLDNLDLSDEDKDFVRSVCDPY